MLWSMQVLSMQSSVLRGLFVEFLGTSSCYADGPVRCKRKIAGEVSSACRGSFPSAVSTNCAARGCHACCACCVWDAVAALTCVVSPDLRMLCG